MSCFTCYASAQIGVVLKAISIENATLNQQQRYICFAGIVMVITSYNLQAQLCDMRQ